MSLLLYALAQVGPLVSPGAAPPIALPPAIERDRPPRRHAAPQTARVAPAPPTSAKLGECLALIDSSPDDAGEYAARWIAQTAPLSTGEAEMCLGSARAQQDKWNEAEAAFLAGRDAAADQVLRARLGAMAGNAAMAQQAPERALLALDRAVADAKAAGDPALAADLGLDRTRALVALKRDGDAAQALAEARSALPTSATAWLLSATLSRRMGNLADAQAQILKAADLAPGDPEIGLEAGLIAALAGHDEAARKSLQSVIATAPQSEAAQTARQYLAQLPPAPPVAGPAKRQP